MKFAKKYLSMVAVIFGLLGSNLSAATAEELLSAYSYLVSPVIDSTLVYEVDKAVIEQDCLTINFASGRIYFFESLELDSAEIFVGGIFIGEGQFTFTPALGMERDQLRRFYKEESLDRSFGAMLFYGEDRLIRDIMASSTPVDGQVDKNEIKKAHKETKNLKKRMIEKEKHGFLFRVLKSQTEPLEKPHFLCGVKLDKAGLNFYEYYPHHREQVSLYRLFTEIGSGFVELICSHASSDDLAAVGLNGKSKYQLDVKHYKIDASLSKGGDFTGITEMNVEAISDGLQMISLSLHWNLVIDSILDGSSNKILFLRWEKKKHRRSSLRLILDQPMSKGDTSTWRFFCDGKLAASVEGHYYVYASSNWYPRYKDDRATFDMTFRTHPDRTFLACGEMLDSTKSENVLTTRWRVSNPTNQVSFNMGNLKEYKFTEDAPMPVRVFIDKELHQGTGTRNIEKYLGSDICNSLKLFTHYFGPIDEPELCVSEIVADHGQAFSGFLHLSYLTFTETDTWGWDRIFRAHEVAHQWWGMDVGNLTYHDKWLTEGFSEYAGFLYLQAAVGNDDFLDRLRDYREDIFSNRKYLLGGGEEAGPIALGYRTSTSKTRGDYGLIIYKKGAYVLHMLRNLLLDLSTLNDDRFFDMMKDWHATFKGKRATTNDFQAMTEKYAGVDMSWFFDQFIYGEDLPTYKFSHKISQNSDGKYEVVCKITTKGVSDNFRMYVPLEIDFGNDSRVYLRLLIDQPEVELTLPPLDKKPKKLRLNPFESVLARVDQ